MTQMELSTMKWHEVANAAFNRALRGWKQTAAPNIDIQDLFATSINKIETTIVHKARGRLMVTICIHAKKAHQSVVYVYEASRVSPGQYRITEGFNTKPVR